MYILTYQKIIITITKELKDDDDVEEGQQMI